MKWWVTVFITEFYLLDINTRRHPGGEKKKSVSCQTRPRNIILSERAGVKNSLSAYY